jgi:TonB family protein
MPFDLKFWRQWEGRSLDRVFPLERCLGGSSRNALFEMQFQGRSAVAKLIPGTPESIAAQLERCQKTARLSHPALLQIFKTGEAALGDSRCAYLVMERADENLAEVLTDRLLTPAEARAMLQTLVGALRYLESKGFAFESLEPASIMAVGEQLKISSDSLVQVGDSGADCRPIGNLLEEALGGGAGQNAELPEPFAEIARGCLAPDPAARWKLGQIEAHLRGDAAPAAAAPGESRAKAWGLGAAAAAILGLVAMWPSPADRSSQATGVTVQPGTATPAAQAAKKSPAAKAPAKKPPTARIDVEKPSPIPLIDSVKARPAEQRPAAPVTVDDGITRVLPQIPQQARNTIVGRVRISVRVHVDSQGNVSQASVEPPPASQYFTGRVLTAARAWKFPAANSPREWVLRFELGREQTRVSLVKAAN